MAEAEKQRVPEVSLQQLLDCGLNGFALQLLVESIVDVKKKAEFSRIEFSFRGVKFAFDWSEPFDGRHH